VIAQPITTDKSSEGKGDEENALWMDFKIKNSVHAREKLFIKYLPIARRIAWKLHKNDAKSPVEYRELVQLASVGLLESIDRYKPDLGVPFRYFCTRRISGSILSGIAKLTEVNQQISSRNQVARERLKSMSSGVDTSNKMGDVLDILGEVSSGLALGLMLDNPALYIEHDIDPAKNAYETLAWKEAVDHVRCEVNALPERERELVRLHYIEGIAFDQIAELFGLSKGRISQIHKAAMTLLHKRLSAIGRFELKG
jgi:RNA polymerase sigma factor FliA